MSFFDELRRRDEEACIHGKPLILINYRRPPHADLGQSRLEFVIVIRKELHLCAFEYCGI